MKKPTQNEKLLELLSDGKPHSAIEIQEVVYGAEHAGSAAIPSRISDLRQLGHVIEAKPGKVNKSVWWWKLTKKAGESEGPSYRIEHRVIIKDGMPVAVPYKVAK